MGTLKLGQRLIFRSLRFRNYRLYIAGSALSVCGTWMQRVSQDWLVLQLSGSGVSLGVATALQFTPVLLAGLWGGAVVDRVDRRRLVLATQAAQALLALLLGGLTVAGLVTLWMVYLLALLLGVVTVFDSPGRQAFVAEMVSSEDISNAQALYSSVHNTGRLVGPAAAGVVIAEMGVGAAFLINAASFIAVLTALWHIEVAQLHRTPPRPRSPGEVREGLIYVWRHRELSASLFLVAVIALFGQNFRVVLPLLAEQTLHGDARTYGYLTAALGAGAVIGALGSATRTHPTSRQLVLSCLAFGALNLVTAGTTTFGLVMLGMALMGVANIVFNTFARSLLLVNSGPRMQGRVMSLHVMVFLGSRPAGGLLVGWLCSLWGARAGLVVAGSTAAAAALALLPLLRGLGLSHMQMLATRPEAAQPPAAGGGTGYGNVTDSGDPASRRNSATPPHH